MYTPISDLINSEEWAVLESYPFDRGFRECGPPVHFITIQLILSEIGNQHSEKTAIRHIELNIIF
jgi:hypothetical protein